MHRSAARHLTPVLLLAAITTSPARSGTLTREFRYAPQGVRLVASEGWTHVQVQGAVAERRPGRPDLPAVAERVELPADMKVVGVEVTALETAPLAEGVRIAPALVIRHDAREEHLSAPDPSLYALATPQPANPVVLGVQGFERGHRVAWLLVTPVRWMAATGRLERIRRLAVRLTLAPSRERPLARGRVVPEWEAGGARVPRPVDGVTATSPGLPAGAVVKPAAPQPFAATQLPSLLGSPVAYVIVTNDALAPTFQTLADWKTQCGLPAVVRTLSFIRQQYPVAADDPERIRLFLRDAYTRWGTRWVLLGGDTDVIPPRLAHNVLVDGDIIPSDLYYSCLDGNWNADGDSTWADGFANADDPGDDADLLPEMWVGRAPAVTVADAQRFVQKTLSYERTPVSDQMNNVLFFAQVLTPQPWHLGQTVQLDGAQFVEQDILPTLDTVPWVHGVRMYQNYTDSRWRPGALPETKAAVDDSLQRGYNIAVHIGHGYREVMACGDDNLTSNDANALANGARLTNFYAIDCTSNAIDYSSIGEALMRAPNGGAVTNIGSTSLDFPTVGRTYQKEFFQLLYEDSVTAIGEAEGRQKLPFVGRSYYDGFDRICQLELLLLGDPELRVFTNTPRELTVTAPSTVAADDSTLTIGVAVLGVPLENARVTAWMPNHEYRTGLTDGTGTLVLPFHPDSVGPVTLTVTAFNARPWQGTTTVTAGGAAALQPLPFTVLDDNTGGRAGNGNGIAEAGETVDVVIPVRNAGGTTAAGVGGTLGTGDPLITVAVPTADYGDVAPGSTVSPAAGFRVVVPFDCPDQRDVPLSLDLLDQDGHHTARAFELVIRSPELRLLSHTESEQTGNHDGQPQPGETVVYSFDLRNTGNAPLHGLTGVLRNLDGLASVLDSTFTVPDLAPGADGSSSAVRFTPSDTAAQLQLRVSDASGLRLVQTLALGYPAPAMALVAEPGAAAIQLSWAHSAGPHLAGYTIYRGASSGGPFARVAITGPASTFTDVGLAALTKYFYVVGAVDSSGNESGASSPASATTNPGLHAGFPRYTRETSATPVAVEHVYAGAGRDILVGGDVLHLFRPDGSAPIDADGNPATPGDFTTIGRYYAGGGSITDLDNTGTRQIVGAAWTSQQLVALGTNGQPRAGFPVHVNDPMWSSVAVGDLDGDGHKEMVFASLGRAMYAFRGNGSEWMDGDANPSTVGVFRLMNSTFNIGTPALADLLGNGKKDVIEASLDGFLYAWQPDGSNVPGFPVNLGAGSSASVALARLDGPGQPYSIIACTNDNRLRVRLASGANRTGFPVVVVTTGSDRQPSPAIADMNGDGIPDIVVAGTDGKVYVYDRNGALVAPWTGVRYSPLEGASTMSSPVVADINGDGKPDVVIGDEDGDLAALSGVDGGMLPGFPIRLDGEGSGAAAVCDCDGDGKSEIVDVDYGGTVWMWDYDFPFSPAGPAPWPQFHHDAERTGCADTPLLPTAVDPGADVPHALALGSPWPNPARAGVQVSFAVPKAHQGDAAEVAVYDPAGRRVRTLLEGHAEAGRVALTWDLRDGRGAPVAGGLYLVRARAGRETVTRKVVVLP